jgi:hypothetical protein
MRPCYNLHCVDGKEPIYSLADDTSENVVGWEDCYICHGTGEVEDGCYCAAHEPSECCCGAWSDVEDWWYEDDYDYNHYHGEEE